MRFNENTVKRIWKLEKLNNRLRKVELDLEFKSNDNSFVPKFLNFRVSNNRLRYSSTYKECQSYLLSKESREKNLQYEI